MKAIILAAGRGSRMGDGTAQLPKCMMTLCGKTMLDRCIESLLKAGFQRSDIGIVTGYKKEKIQIEGVNYFHNANWEQTNMFISLTMAREWLINETCIVCYSDILFHENAVKKLMDCQHELALTYYTGFWELWLKRFENPLEDLETFKMDGDKLIEIGKKAASKDEIQGQYMGLIRFDPDSWKKVEEAVKLPMPKPLERLDMTTMLNHMISLNHDVKAIKTDDFWLECDNQNDIAIYEREFPELLN